MANTVGRSMTWNGRKKSKSAKRCDLALSMSLLDARGVCSFYDTSKHVDRSSKDSVFSFSLSPGVWTPALRKKSG